MRVHIDLAEVPFKEGGEGFSRHKGTNKDEVTDLEGTLARLGETQSIPM